MRKVYYVRQYSDKALKKLNKDTVHYGVRHYYQHNEMVSVEYPIAYMSECYSLVDGKFQVVMGEDLRETPWQRKKGLVKGGIKCIDPKKK